MTFQLVVAQLWVRSRGNAPELHEENEKDENKKSK